jgi:2-oxoglutarate dehydrogenase E1 component
LTSAQTDVRSSPPRRRGMRGFTARWEGLHARYRHAAVATGVPAETLRMITERLTRTPDDFNVHPKIVKIFEARRKDVAEGRAIDWATGEALAFGSLVLEGTPVRVSGQDSRRGTFSHRHAVLFDTKTNDVYIPLNTLAPDQAPFNAYDSLLSEAAVLGFDYGYTLDDPQTLVLWEAQFGDFANGAQVIIDQVIASGESKWQRASGIVLLLPHGYEGQGPEHSSARLERFLQLCAEDNIQVANLTTPAQYFHALRRQIKRDFRKPLIVMTPKSLLRHKEAVSPLEEFATGHFREVLDDPRADPECVRRVLLCSGKVYYDLTERRTEQQVGDVAVVRLEQFYPFPEEQLRSVLNRYRRAHGWVWVQEESQNMGGWAFVEPRLRAMGVAVEYVGRDASASPATGSHRVHEREQKELVEAALTGSVPHVVRATPAVAPKRTREFETEAKAPKVGASS